MKEQIKKYLLRDILDIIRLTKIETPEVVLNCTLLNQEEDYLGYITTFEVLLSSLKGKIKNYFKEESKVKISGTKKDVIGTVLGVDKNVITVLVSTIIKSKNVKIQNLPNMNNYKILEYLEHFLKKNEKIKPEIISGWNDKTEIDDKDLERFKKENQPEHSLNDIQNETSDLLNAVEEISISRNNFDNVNENQDEIPKIMNFFNKDLNDSQKVAVRELYSNNSYKIIGPPGTGKTRTILEIILQMMSLKNKILVIGPSNTSIDNIIQIFLDSDYYKELKPVFYRLGSFTKGLCQYNINKIVCGLTSFLDDKNEKTNFFKAKLIKKKYTRDIEKNTDLVFSTVFSSLKILKQFDWVIVDEACQANIVETFLTVHKARNFILVGDPNQLCPDTESLYEKINLPTFLLNTQYRMSKKLMEFSNQTFYDNKIISHIENITDVIEGYTIIFVDTELAEFHEEEFEASKMNRGEADVVLKIVNFLETEDVGVITPYSAQTELIKEKTMVEVSTVDGFQGREKNFIILSLVRSNINKDFGFLDNEKRLNVAITRAKKGIFVVGDSSNFRKSRFYSKYFNYLEKNALVLMPEELDEIILNCKFLKK